MLKQIGKGLFKTLIRAKGGCLNGANLTKGHFCIRPTNAVANQFFEKSLALKSTPLYLVSADSKLMSLKGNVRHNVLEQAFQISFDSIVNY